MTGDQSSHTRAAPTSVYRYYDTDDVLIYVGITGRGVARNIEHNKSKEWWPHVARQEIDHFATREEALAEERRLIGTHLPPFNRQHNPQHELARASYLSVIKAAEFAASTNRLERQQRRKHLPLYPLEVPFPGDKFTLRSSLDDLWLLRGELIQNGQTHQRVTTPRKPKAGRVTSCRFAGGMLVVGINGKHLPDKITRARAKIAVQNRHPVGFMLSHVLLNEPESVGGERRGA